ncbi:MAG: hypothetical protein Q9220_001011 [cf. Caloplaca sp. 1 TL-2023]
MSEPPPIPTPTLLLVNLPVSILCGIDLLTFTTTPTFLGIKSLSSGLHFLFTSPSASFSLRSGFFFSIPPPSPSTPPSQNLISRKWDPETEDLVPCTLSEVKDIVNEKGGWQAVYEKHLTPYRQSAGSDDTEAAAGGRNNKEDAWPDLTRHVSPALLTRFTSNDEWRISSASSGLQDRDEIPGLSFKEVETVIGGEEGVLGMLGIDLRVTWPEGAVGRERTEMARDTSWKLGDVVRRLGGYGSEGGKAEGEGREWGDAILGQMEVCFLMVLTLANYSCLEEWKRCLGLVLRCERLLGERSTFFVGALRLLRGQLERVDDVEGGLFDMSDDGSAFLRELLKGFKKILERIAASGEEGCHTIEEEFEEVEQWANNHFGWELGGDFVRSGILELEDGETVEMETNELEEEDESGEYAPVIVDLG